MTDPPSTSLIKNDFFNVCRNPTNEGNSNNVLKIKTYKLCVIMRILFYFLQLDFE